MEVKTRHHLLRLLEEFGRSLATYRQQIGPSKVINYKLSHIHTRMCTHTYKHKHVYMHIRMHAPTTLGACHTYLNSCTVISISFILKLITKLFCYYKTGHNPATFRLLLSYLFVPCARLSSDCSSIV